MTRSAGATLDSLMDLHKALVEDACIKQQSDRHATPLKQPSAGVGLGRKAFELVRDGKQP